MTEGVAIPAPRYPAKIAAPGDALSRIAALPRPLVFTNGVFDVLHRGHVTCLDQARALGAALVVAVNSDASVRRLGKAGARPLNSLIESLAPDVLVKGGDYTADTTAGAPEVIAAGGRFVAIPFASAHSTSALVAKIRGGPG